MIRAAGWACLAAALVCIGRMWWIDLTLQRFRVPDAPRGAYLVVPMRWQRRLYGAVGQPLITRAWWTVAWMYVFGVLGSILLGSGR